jgi:sulfur carrier protein
VSIHNNRHERKGLRLDFAGSQQVRSARASPPFPVPDLTITLNGEPYELQEPLTLAALLERLDIDPRRVAVEHNLTVVKRARYEETVVTDGDRLEIVNFVGGGSAEGFSDQWHPTP